MHNLWETISEIAMKLHPDKIEVLAGKISSLNNLDDLERTRNNIGSMISKELIDKMEMSWKKNPEIKPIEVASALRGASAAISFSEKNESVELVWTGPPVGLVPIRHTEQVLHEVIGSSTQKLFIVSFVAYNIDSIVGSLEKAATRNVRIDILLESSKADGGKVDIDSIHVFRNRIPSANIYKWRSAAQYSGELFGAVHAKCAVADGHLAFITSANLTKAAMERNMEIGVLVRGGNLPEMLQRHLESLIVTELVEKI